MIARYSEGGDRLHVSFADEHDPGGFIEMH